MERKKKFHKVEIEKIEEYLPNQRCEVCFKVKNDQNTENLQQNPIR